MSNQLTIFVESDKVQVHKVVKDSFVRPDVKRYGLKIEILDFKVPSKLLKDKKYVGLVVNDLGIGGREIQVSVMNDDLAFKSIRSNIVAMNYWPDSTIKMPIWPAPIERVNEIKLGLVDINGESIKQEEWFANETWSVVMRLSYV